MKCVCARVPGSVISRSLHSGLLRGAKGIIKYLQCSEAALVHLMYNLSHALLVGKKEFAVLESLGFVDVSRYHPAQGWNQCCHCYHKDNKPFVGWFQFDSVEALGNFFSSFYCQFISWYLAIVSNQTGVRTLSGKQFTQDKNELKWSDWKYIYFEKLSKK